MAEGGTRKGRREGVSDCAWWREGRREEVQRVMYKSFGSFRWGDVRGREKME